MREVPPAKGSRYPRASKPHHTRQRRSIAADYADTRATTSGNRRDIPLRNATPRGTRGRDCSHKGRSTRANVANARTDCPTWREPIRREVTAGGHVRFFARVDATAPGSTKRRQAAKRCDTLARARAYVEQVRAELARAGTFAPADTETVRKLCDPWLESRGDVLAVTHDGYCSALIAPLRHIGDRLAREVTRSEWRTLVARLATNGGRREQALSPRIVCAALIALGQAFAFAVEDGVIPASPVNGVKPPRWQSSRALRSNTGHRRICGLSASTRTPIHWRERGRSLSPG